MLLFTPDFPVFSVQTVRISINPSDCPELFRNPARAQRLQLRGWSLWVISWGCCSVPKGTPGRRWGWRSASSWLSAPHPPSSSGSLPLSDATFPAWKTSRSLCPGAPLCGYCSVLQDGEPQVERGMKYNSTTKTSWCILNLQCLTWLQDKTLCCEQINWVSF